MTAETAPVAPEVGAWCADVVGVRLVGPRLARVELGGAGLRDYVSDGAPDESVTLHFPRAGERRPPAMTFDGGAWGYHGAHEPPTARNYTVRAVDPARGTLTVDFVLHGDGVASRWAAAAAPGDGLVLWRRRSWYRPPSGTAWVVLAADLTGLPAVLRAVEQLAAQAGRGPRCTVLLDVVDEHDATELRSLAGPGVHVDVRAAGNGVAPGTLLERIARWRVPAVEPGYAWFAGPADEARRARSLWRGLHGQPRDRVTAVGYWRHDG